MRISSFGKGYEVDSIFKPKDNSLACRNPFFLIDGCSPPRDSKYRLLGIPGNQLPDQFRIVIEYGISLQEFEEGKVDQFYAERFGYASAEPQQGRGCSLLGGEIGLDKQGIRRVLRNRHYDGGQSIRD
jgi:hypothetical protein